MPRPSCIACGAALAALAICAAPGSASPGKRAGAPKLQHRAAPKPPLRQAGRWITDRHGRVAILHGINMVYKLPPYAPSAIGFGGDDADFLARFGFDTVRLGVIEKGVEPQPGRYAGDYIRDIRSTERLLARRGIFSLVDFHQDLYNEKFGGEGWPDWAVLDDGLDPKPSGFPITYLVSPGLNRAFDNFWENESGPGGVGIQNRYAAAWRRVARSFGRDAGVLGYDLLNEPWPGTSFSRCRDIDGCPGFDRRRLGRFYRRVVGRIRGVDRSHLVFYEPHVLFNTGADTNIPRLPFGRLGFSFHDYCFPGLVAGAPSGCAEIDEAVFDNADAHSRRTGDALLLSEFGATRDLSILTRIADLADRHMVSWQEWHYCGCKDPTTAGPGNIQALVKDPAKPPRGENVFRKKLRALSRPYPQSVAGTPARFSFDPASRRFVLVYRTDRAGVRGRFQGGLSDIFVPKLQYYPEGYRARARGGGVR
jgi:endoglycosylceramidase